MLVDAKPGALLRLSPLDWRTFQKGGVKKKKKETGSSRQMLG